MNDYQLLIIGSGPGGYAAALKAAELGLSTAVIEKDEPGGTCVNRGCVPTKALLHASDIYRSALSASAIWPGIADAGVPDIRGIFQRKDDITSRLRHGIVDTLKRSGIPLIKARALIREPHAVELLDRDGSTDASAASGSILTSDNILIAAGSVPFVPKVQGIDLPQVMTSDDILRGQDRIFESLVIIGGGVIGVELAVFYSDMGCRVTLIEGTDRLLPGMDRELGQNLSLIMKKQGIKVLTGTMLKRIEDGPGSGVTVCGESRGKEIHVSAEACLCAIGRIPCTGGLFADGLKPEMDGARIRTDDSLHTSIEGIYAIGDVSDRIQLAHSAEARGQAAAGIIAGLYAADGSASVSVPAHAVRLDLVPGCIYCRPEIASVGLTEAEAKALGIRVKTGKSIMFSNARTMIEDPGRCFMKVVADAGTGEILGAQLMCPHASDIISEITAAIANHLTAEDMLRIIRPHPSFEEALKAALEDIG